MDDFVRTIPLESATGGGSDDSEDDERLDFGFKFDDSESESSELLSESEGGEGSSGEDGLDANSGSDDDASGTSDDESGENGDEEDDGSVEEDEAVAGAAEAGTDATDAADEPEEPSKIPKYKPGTTEKVPEFSELHLSRPLLRAVKELGYEIPTTIQVRRMRFPLPRFLA